MKSRSLQIDSPWWKSPGTIPDALKAWGEMFIMKQKALDAFLLNDFVFSPRYRLARHGLYWLLHITIWSVFWLIMDSASISFWRYMLNMTIWVPAFMLFGYPLAFWAGPRLLFNG